MHAEHLEAVHGVGPAYNQRAAYHAEPMTLIPETFDNGIDDDTFAKIVACIRISVPYTGMIVSTRESQKPVVNGCCILVYHRSAAVPERALAVM